MLESFNSTSLYNPFQNYTSDPSNKASHERLSTDPKKNLKTCCSIVYLNTLSSPINLTNRPFLHVANFESVWGSSSLAFFCAWQQNTLYNTEKLQKMLSPTLVFLWRNSGRIFSISQVDFACLIKSSSLTSCLTSPSSLLLGAYSPAGATSQTDCCPAGMGLAARQGPEAHSPWAFV